MRNNLTKAESILRKRYLKRLKVPVLRQKPLDHYIADFYIPSAKLVIEVDGLIHSTQKAIAYDKKRTELLMQYGIRVIRFTNEQICD